MEDFTSVSEEKVLYRGNHFFIMDDSFPVSPGHILIISNEIRKDYFELNRSELDELNVLIHKCKEIIKLSYNPDGYNIGMNCGEAAGQTVFHFHCHVIPRYKGDMNNPKGGVRHCVEGKGYYYDETNQVNSNRIHLPSIKGSILKANPIRGKKLAELLYHKFLNEGIHGRTDMPEDEPPEGVARGSLEHLCFITFTVAIDYMRDAPTLWNNSKQTFLDPETSYLFFPKEVEKTSFAKVVKDMQKHGLSKKPERDANIWHTIGTSFARKWGGDPLNFVKSNAWDCIKILEHLIIDRHYSNEKLMPDFPNLRGPKIGPLWIRMLRDNVGLSQLVNLDKVPLPIDIHIARATLTTGVLTGTYSGSLAKLFPEIRAAWKDSISGLSIKGRPMIVLDIDEPLWHLSKYGCSGNRDKISGICSVRQRCEAKDFCIRGRVSVENKLTELNT